MKAVWTRHVWRLLLFLMVFSVCACQQKMASQPSYKPLDASSFFEDRQSARPLVPGTVARGHLRTDLALFRGKRSGEEEDWTQPVGVVGAGTQGPLGALAFAVAEQSDYVDTFPIPITREVVQHGQDRFMIYCVVCHDPLGTGSGKIVERGYTRPPSYHIERLRRTPVGRLFEVISDGYGSMPSYRDQIPPRDRWAIIAYLRALQLSQHFPKKDLSDEMRQELEKSRSGGQPP